MRIIHRKKIRLKIYPILWSGIIVAAVYLLLRFAAISFTHDMGQAVLKDALISKLFCEVVESGHGLLEFTADTQKDTYAFPISVLEDELALYKYAGADTMETALSGEYSVLGQDQTPVLATDEQEPIDQTIHGQISIHEISGGFLTKEYIMTNGAVFNRLFLEESLNPASGELTVGYTEGNIDKKDKEVVDAVATQASPIEYTMEQLKDVRFLVRNFYIVDGTTRITDELFDAEKLLGKDMKLQQENSSPQILIYHTHTSEKYIDSRPGELSDTIVGVGDYLTKILTEDYGYNVIHDTTNYHFVDGVKAHDAYLNSLKGITAILDEYPSIEVLIDLHRDSPAARNVIIDGKETAQVMLFNGLCRDQNGPLTNLDNPYLQDNLAFSLQLQLKSNTMYPGLFYRNYLKAYRYNLHLRPKSLLVELGTDDNTLESAMNALKPFAEVLDTVLKGD